MVLQKAVKTYPMVKWFVIVSLVVLGLGVVMSGILSDSKQDNLGLLIGAVVAAILLPFLALAFPRRQVLTMELPSDHLAGLSRQELEGTLASLDEAKAKGEMDNERYSNARARVQAALKAKGK